MTLVLLPGYGCRSWIWRSVTEGLRHSGEALALDWPLDDMSAETDLNALSRWVADRVPDNALLAGHSMGGLVALKAAGLSKVRGVVLVESFITDPPPFFRNLLYQPEPALESEVMSMLRTDGPRYPQHLRDQISQVDALNCLPAADCRVAAIYGNRGAREAEAREALGWTEDIARHIPVSIVDSAAHFPMLENPEGFMTALRETLASLPR